MLSLPALFKRKEVDLDEIKGFETLRLKMGDAVARYEANGQGHHTAVRTNRENQKKKKEHFTNCGNRLL